MPTTYYVDTAADAGGDGTTQELTGANCAFKTIAQVNAGSFAAGDSMLFKKGCTWREQLTIPTAGSAGNPITYGSYGSGASPKIYGSDVPSSWTEEIVADAINKIQDNKTGISGAGDYTTVTVTWNSTPAVGNLLIAIARGYQGTIASASISGYTLAESAVCGSSGAVGIFYKIAGVGETGATLVWTGATASVYLAIEEWSPFASAPLDKINHTNNTGGTTSRSSGTTPATTVNDELCIAAIGWGGAVTGLSWTNSFASEYASLSLYAYASLVISSTGTQETTASWTTSRVNGCCIATFKGNLAASKTLHYAAQAANPVGVWFIATDGTIHTGSEKATKGDLAAEYDWWFDDPNNRLYVYAATDPGTRYTSVEVGSTTRNRGIMWLENNHDYHMISGFEVAFVVGNGIVIRGNDTVTDCTVHHLAIEAGAHSFGIELNAGSNSHVYNNTVYECSKSGIFIVASYAPFVSSDNIIENNAVYDCKDSCIKLATEASTVEMDANIVRYNHLYQTASFVRNAGAGQGIYIYGLTADNLITSTQIYYNNIHLKYSGIYLDSYSTDTVVYNNSIMSSLGFGIRVTGTGTTVAAIKNNLIADAALGALGVTTKTMVTACDNNLWYATTGTIYVTAEGTDYHADDFAAYKSDTGWDAGGLWESPDIVSTETPDFHLQSSSPCINAGVDIGFTADYSGNTVPAGSDPDIGAYERAADELVGSSLGSATQAATLEGAGILLGSSSAIAAASGTLGGAGTLTASAFGLGSETAILSGFGNLVGAAGGLANISATPNLGFLYQSGYRWRNDNGNEEEATWRALQNAGMLFPNGENVRIRFLIDTQGDLDATAFQLEYRLQDGEWQKVA